ncbi:MAG: thiamine-phosphate pyrophosphorylase [Candidatus Omnitrophota bacterium]|nr:thiamine-phosphate pyrophosphorylase [Candidatus Omnitrophota bacterium]
MQKIDKKILRIIDANINRLKEGLRVCEDAVRFGLDSSKLTIGFKQVRHRLVEALKVLRVDTEELLASRDIRKDVGKPSVPSELLRRNFREVFLANLQRIKESVRVLEEFSKIYDQRAALYFKDIRYRIYNLEKDVFKKFHL